MGRRTIILEASDNDRVVVASEELTPKAYQDFCKKNDIEPMPARSPVYDAQTAWSMLRDVERFFRSIEMDVRMGITRYEPPREIHYAIDELCKGGFRDDVNRIAKECLGNLAPDVGVLQWIASTHLKESNPYAEPSYPANHRRYETRYDARSLHLGRFQNRRA